MYSGSFMTSSVSLVLCSPPLLSHDLIVASSLSASRVTRRSHLPQALELGIILKFSSIS